MILDIFDNAQRYLALNKGFAKAIEFLSNPDLNELSAGEYEIDGSRVYAMVFKKPGRMKEGAQLEAHEKYIDFQVVLAGTDNMGWKSKCLCNKSSGNYDQQRDVQFFADEPDAWLSVKSGSFAIFFPEDAHMPTISSEEIHKVVVKIAVTQI